MKHGKSAGKESNKYERRKTRWPHRDYLTHASTHVPSWFREQQTAASSCRLDSRHVSLLEHPKRFTTGKTLPGRIQGGKRHTNLTKTPAFVKLSERDCLANWWSLWRSLSLFSESLPVVDGVPKFMPEDTWELVSLKMKQSGQNSYLWT